MGEANTKLQRHFPVPRIELKTAFEIVACACLDTSNNSLNLEATKEFLGCISEVNIQVCFAPDFYVKVSVLIIPVGL